jgi:alkylation response protein AidB-like acyl-CoA dehydrogenase
MFEFTEEHEPLVREVREMAENVVKPRTKEIEENDEFPVDMANRFFKEGYLQKRVLRKIWNGKELVRIRLKLKGALMRTAIVPASIL